MGVFIIPSVPLMIEWGCQLIYPINDSFCIGIMYSGATMAGSFIGSLLTIISKGIHADKLLNIINIVYLPYILLW